MAKARWTLLAVSGPNLQLLGKREPDIYGTTTLAQIHRALVKRGRELNARVVTRQSNIEGELVTWVGEAGSAFDGILINPGAYTHTSIALLDAISASELPTIEVHLSNPDAREAFRRRSRIAQACLGRIAGFGPLSYTLALEGLVRMLENAGR